MLNDEPNVYTLTRAAPSGPFSVWHPFLDIVWPPLLGSSGLGALRALALATDTDVRSEVFEVAELASLIGVAPVRFVSAVHRLSDRGLMEVADNELFVPRYVHGPSVDEMATLPLISQRAAWTRLTQGSVRSSVREPRTD